MHAIEKCNKKKSIQTNIVCVLRILRRSYGWVQPRVRRSSVDRVLSCFKTGLSSILGSVTQGGFSHWATGDEEMDKNLSEWQRMNVLYECNGNYVLNMYKKKWHDVTTFKKKFVCISYDPNLYISRAEWHLLILCIYLLLLLHTRKYILCWFKSWIFTLFITISRSLLLTFSGHEIMTPVEISLSL